MVTEISYLDDLYASLPDESKEALNGERGETRLILLGNNPTVRKIYIDVARKIGNQEIEHEVSGSTNRFIYIFIGIILTGYCAMGLFVNPEIIFMGLLAFTLFLHFSLALLMAVFWLIKFMRRGDYIKAIGEGLSGKSAFKHVLRTGNYVKSRMIVNSLGSEERIQRIRDAAKRWTPQQARKEQFRRSVLISTVASGLLAIPVSLFCRIVV